jgi:hypothetical protein
MWKRNSNRPQKKEKEREEAMVVIVAGVTQNKRTALPKSNQGNHMSRKATLELTLALPCKYISHKNRA